MNLERPVVSVCKCPLIPDTQLGLFFCKQQRVIGDVLT